MRIITALVIILIALSSIGSGATTTWRHSGFTLIGYDIDLNGFNITGSGTLYCSGYSYCISIQGSNIIAVNGTTQNIDYSGPDANTVIRSAVSIGNILIMNGTYTVNNISVPDGRTITGSGHDTILYNPTTINEALPLNSTLYLGDDSIVERIRFEELEGTLDGNEAIRLIGNRTTIQDNWFYHGGQAIYMINSTNNIVRNNYIYKDVDSPPISENHGIMLSLGSNYNVIENNEIINGQRGIYFINASYNIISKNTILNQTAYQFNLFAGSGYNTITDNIFRSEYAINAIQIEQNQWSEYGLARGNVICSNTITGSTSAGISLIGSTHYVNNTIVCNNMLYDTTRGINLGSNSSNSLVIGNHFNNMYTNGFIENGTKNVVINNYFYGSQDISIGSNAKSYIHSNNYGYSHFDFGNNATYPTAFGSGDIYFNTSANLPCFYNGTAWNHYNNNSGGC